MAEFLRAKGVDRLKLKPFLLEQAERLKKHSFKVAKEAGRPCQYLTGHARKDELAQEIAKKDGVEHGLVCMFSVVEPCRSFSLVWKNLQPPSAVRGRSTGRPLQNHRQIVHEMGLEPIRPDLKARGF